MITPADAAPPADAPAPRPASSLWRHRDFLKLWAGTTVSRFGSQVSLLAIPFVAITLLDAGPLEMGLLTSLEMVPFLLVTLPAGAWVDRLRKRPILISGDLGRTLLLASIPLAWWLGVLTMAQLYAVALATGLLTVFFDVADQSFLPVLVDREQIVDGNAKLQVSESAAGIAGPGIAGYLIGILGAPVAVLVDAASFATSAVAVLAIRRREPAPVRRVDATGAHRSIRSEMSEGLRYVATHPYLRSIAASTAWSNTFNSIASGILVLYVYRQLGLGAETIGVAFGLGNLGALVGAVLAPRIAARAGVGRAILIGMAAGCPSTLLVAVATREAAFALIVASGLLIGFSSMVYNINQVSLRQAITPGPLLGRMNASMKFIVVGVYPIGAFVGGVIGSTFGLTTAIWVAAIGELFAFVPLLIGPVLSLREIPAVEGEGPAAESAEPEAAEPDGDRA